MKVILRNHSALTADEEAEEDDDDEETKDHSDLPAVADDSLGKIESTLPKVPPSITEMQ